MHRPSPVILLLALALALPSYGSADAKRHKKRRAKTRASKLVKIPAGTYVVHIPGSDTGATHPVDLKAFSVQPREVTVGDYRRCVLSAKCSEPKTGTYFSLAQRRQDFQDFCNWGHKGRDSYPVNCLDRQQAAEYCASRGLRLPSSAQWEAAAYGSPAAKHRTKYAFTKPLSDSPTLCWARKDKRLGTCATDAPGDDVTRLGIGGMAANVTEWTRTEACAGAGKCMNKSAVVRGGNWYNAYAVKVGLGRMRLLSAKGTDHTLGFRCVSK